MSARSPFLARALADSALDKSDLYTLELSPCAPMLTLPAACALQVRRMETLLALGAVVNGAVHGMLCTTCISATPR